MKHAFMSLCAAAALAGCGSLSGLDAASSFSCKAPDGVKCDSVSGTYHNAVQGNLPAARKPTSAPESPVAPTISAAVTTARDASPTAVSTGTKTPAAGPSFATQTPQALRAGPRILRMWVKPWEDADRDLHGESVVFIQVESGRWLVDAAQRQAREPYAPVRAAAPGKPLASTTPPLSREVAPAANQTSSPTDLASILRSLRRAPSTTETDD